MPIVARNNITIIATPDVIPNRDVSSTLVSVVKPRKKRRGSSFPSTMLAVIAVFAVCFFTTSRSQNFSLDTMRSMTFERVPPPMCTEDQLSTLKKQLSPEECIANQQKPWNQKCSFTKASSCPDNRWLQWYHATTTANVFTSVFVGCNKAIDAVDALRMGSHNTTHDVEAWRKVLSEGKPDKFARSSCNQLEREEGAKFPTSTTPNPATVYCLEPMPTTAAELTRTNKYLQWGNELVVHRAALSSQPGSMLVQAAGAKGIENKGIENFEADCNVNPEHCEQVPIYTLDDYVQNNMTLAHAKHNTTADRTPIHYLSIDVEGFDFAVLQGSTKTLSRVHYLEFEYNWVGPWKDLKLKDALDLLEKQNFVCYWMGERGRLWRISGCWQEHYELHFWSNVACVNMAVDEAAALADKMETMFLETLADPSVQY